MADGDYYARNLAPKWGKVKDQIAGGFSAEDVAGFARLAVGETMRRAHGVPGFEPLSDAFTGAVAGDRGRWVRTRDRVLRDVNHHANTEKFVEAGTALLETQALRLQSLDSAELSQQLAEAGIERVAGQHLARCSQDGLTERFDSRADLAAFEEEVMAHMAAPRLAAELVQHPNGDGFRTPRRTKPVAGTAALLNKPLGKP